jgi:hypothetical protein
MDAPRPVARALELAQRPGEPSLRLRKLAVRDQHLGAAGAAELEQRGVARALHERHHDLVPPHEPTHVAGVLGGAGHEAAHVAEHGRVDDLAAGRSGHRLVEPRQAGLDVAAVDQGEPQERDPARLEVGVLPFASRGDRGLGVLDRIGGVRS